MSRGFSEIASVARMLSELPHATPTRDWRHPWCSRSCPRHQPTMLERLRRAIGRWLDRLLEKWAGMPADYGDP